ncbi:type II toxin-antitoxin system prevent-host-death family antitoxin [Tsukamurella ocularis]|uniref:type II toxin-antitoxin system prevent-host-death family antitoxin n=1 Tax=Tsukamurella ocularis TaxID=1970234 RepID=UPI0039EF9ABC
MGEAPRSPREVPMHLARAKLTYLVEQARSAPILLTRNGKPIVALVHPEVVENTESVHRSERSAVRANLLAALAILDAEK